VQVFARAERRTDVGTLAGEVRAALAGLPGRDAAWEVAIAAGVLEAAGLDALQPEADDAAPVRDALRGLALAGARVALGTGSAAEVEAALAAVPLDPGARVVARTPEGFAWYGLHPEAYATVARRWAAARGPGRVAVVGLRSIGTTLAAVVHAALAQAGVAAWSCAVRPRGDPFDRRPLLGAGLVGALRGTGADAVLVVDEGPGISGSSLTGAADAVAALGWADRDVVLLAHWAPDGGAFVSDAARARWARFARLAAVDALAPPPGADLSGGAWRRGLPEAAWPAVHPWHERAKWRDGDRVRRWAGLGAWGRATRARAEALAADGLGPPVHGLSDGWLELGWVEGTPLVDADPGLVDAAARLVAHHAARPVGAADVDGTLAWIVDVVAEGLGIAVDPARLRAHVPDAPAVAVDGRMRRHEWVRTPAGALVKTDGFDHCADPFLPGCQQAAWDVAGLAAEVSPALAAAVAGRTGVRPTPFHHVGWRAWRLAEATHGEAGTDCHERARWARVRARAARQLREALPWLG
jgi:hypothetical protein